MSILSHLNRVSSTSAALLASALMALLGSLMALLGAAALLKVEGSRRDSAQVSLQEFQDTFEGCQLLLNTHDGPSEHLDDGLELAYQALEFYGVEDGDWTAGPLVHYLTPAEQRDLREDVSELLMLVARSEIAREGPKGSDERVLKQALGRLELAATYGPTRPAAWYEERGRIYSALGQHDRAAEDYARARRIPPESSRDFYLLGASLLAHGEPDRAESRLDRAVALEPGRFWAWFTLGLCHYDQGRYTDAASDFSVCTTLAPQGHAWAHPNRGLTLARAWSHLNRGLALARAGRLPEARAAHDRSLEIAPDLQEALINRAQTCLELDDAAQALRDLDRALALGHRTPAVLTARAEALSGSGHHDEAELAFSEAIRADPLNPSPLVTRGFSRLTRDRAGAEADFRRALELDPGNARARLGRAHLLRHDDPRAALAQVDSALEADPSLLDALQLRAVLRARMGDPGAEADVERLLQVPTPQRLYNASCALSLLSRSGADLRLVSRALDLLRRALDTGLPRDLPTQDPDLEALRTSPRFHELLTGGKSQ